MDAHLSEWAGHMERLQWSAMIIDKDWRVAWVSNGLKHFLGSQDDHELGVGKHIVEAFLSETYMRTILPESQGKVISELAQFFLSEEIVGSLEPTNLLPEQFLPLIEGIEPSTLPYVWSNTFDYVDPGGDPELPSYQVNGSYLRLNDAKGDPLGALVIFFMAVKPNLMSLLSRGDEAMYERMAKLVEPASHQAAVLFCDLHASGKLSRKLPSAAYFKLVRRLWTGIDEAVANNLGIVGKHAGDGASAFFLVEDLGSASQAAEAAIKTARRIHEVSTEVFDDLLETHCMMKVGLHWGGALFMGQLVPGGRLDVTALGDEVNEAARVEETADAGETLATKQLLERLTPEAASSLGLDLEKMKYTVLSEHQRASEKAVRDAGSLSIAPL